ncbi:hypothetical protein FF38_11030 [Lucilia cuprina]|uniref:Charged multivesicular body protein 5 n=1 Tax=Lucilia cuprina TaxID=7375 RepID=A0A0L0BT13_LUCCU|nr:Charged multivesicular body protein 5 [Lucilia cuprina]KNC23220.1 hypothetical protein FF38_11030 [Lucilia cuprina]
MNRLFGTKSQPKPSLNDAISSLETRISGLDVKIAKLNGELSTYQQKLGKMKEGPAKQHLKTQAMRILKQRKQIESQRDQLQSQSWNMEQATMTQDNLKNTMLTLDAMKSANKELKKQYGKVDIDKIESMQDEMADLMDLNDEIQNTMSRSYEVPDEINEEELDAELDLLYDEELENVDYLAAPEVPQFVDEPEPQLNELNTN